MALLCWRVVVSGRPLGGSVMQTAGNIGAITLKDGSVKAKAQLLPFDGDEYGVFAFVDPILLLNDALRRLSPLPYKAAAPKGPAFCFLNCPVQ